MYIEHEIEPTIGSMLKQGKVVLVTGARQVGKTAALGEHLGESSGYISMENPRDYLPAKQDDALFFESRDLPRASTRSGHAARALRSGNRRLLVARPELVGRVREEPYSPCTNPLLI